MDTSNFDRDIDSLCAYVRSIGISTEEAAEAVSKLGRAINDGLDAVTTTYTPEIVVTGNVFYDDTVKPPPDTWTCDYCGSTNAASAKFCGDGDVRHCGAPRPEKPVQLSKRTETTTSYNLNVTHPGMTAEQFAQTYEGKLQILQNNVDELKVEIGKAFLPIVNKLQGLVTFAWMEA